MLFLMYFVCIFLFLDDLFWYLWVWIGSLSIVLFR